MIFPSSTWVQLATGIGSATVVCRSNQVRTSSPATAPRSGRPSSARPIWSPVSTRPRPSRLSDRPRHRLTAEALLGRPPDRLQVDAECAQQLGVAGAGTGHHATVDQPAQRSPGRRQVMFRALSNVRPSHLLDPKLFDFASLFPAAEAAGNGDVPRLRD